MAMMHEKSHAREGRGGANGNNANWYNSPLWDSTGPKKKVGVVKEQIPEEELTEEQKLKRKQQALLRALY
ncbi:hypothetical protein PHG31p114 [Aeromonas phage 31]|uniref:Uncharacterized protein n=4 Tax=Biquartavirus TaxID=1912143 RepID=Q6U9I6_9CAUD|nr:hypothetical protein ST44RRORF116c [Aeromonas phage 44RR2.8t]YP_238843.1 hypothetical protein PHG31p114 [Aeromonas phage 31]APU00588.1 hypothetical protein [Aeromonas phage 44RR2.8t.2]APU01008.1 hypothetical protein [Aeromonas phage 31.2]APU01919.1 hypothetical protein [Aeromonas phage L9-6]APU02170.1 hypothetical protein [Aeromonas phage Riv-10]APU02417.1 hypothetical protein [Aeromonas phage SW69-9]UYD59668.1 hypothetical protein JNMOADIG_00139 [Aeromonas phage avDM5]UYD60358.1 hypothe